MPTDVDGELVRALTPHVATFLASLIGVLQPNARRDDADLLALVDAARIAGTTKGVVADAVRAGEIPAYGRPRGPKTIKRSDLDSWIASRRVVHAGPDDADIDARMERLRAKKLAKAKGRSKR